MAALSRSSWYSRVWGAATYFARVALSRVRSLRSPPPKGGIAVGRAATASRATADLSTLASSPTVYAALTRVAFGLTVYPIRVYYGHSIGGRRAEPLDPERVPWVGAMLRLLQTPDPADLDALFPAEPGEHLIAQVIADLKMAGIAYVAPTLSASGDIVGLTRLHPSLVTIIRNPAGDELEYRTGGRPRRYPRSSVSCIRLLSWAPDGRAELGVGAGTPLEPLVTAERVALEQTAAMVEQGGADVVVTARNAQGAGFLQVEENRKSVVKSLTTALAGGAGGGRRVFVLPADLEAKDAGLKPADLKAPELLAAARQATLMAIGVVPVEVGGDASTYATAAIQQRVQAAADEWLVGLLEAFLLRPLARNFAKRAGGRWAARADQVTARIDLSSHPGNIATRSEAIARARTLVELGYSTAQAVEAEGLDLPEPAGPPMLGAAPMAGASTPGGAAPRRPVGDAGQDATPSTPPQQLDEAPQRTLGDLFRRSVEVGGEEAPELARVALWRAVEQQRERSDRDLETAAQRVLHEERDAYVERAVQELDRAQRSAAPLARAPAGDGGGVAYGAIDYDAILGSTDSAYQRWLSGLSPDWLTTWEEGAASALDGLDLADIPPARPVPADLAPLEESAAAAADYSRERVRAVVEEGVDRGLTTSEIADLMRQDQAFDRPRALRIARTETVRAQSSGTNARYAVAAEQGVELEQEWITARDGAVRDSHRPLDGVRVAVGGSWTLPGGRETPGPGLSGDPGEDINCRCGRRPMVAGR